MKAKTLAFILSIKPYKERQKLVQCFTEEFGILTGLCYNSAIKKSGLISNGLFADLLVNSKTLDSVPFFTFESSGIAAGKAFFDKQYLYIINAVAELIAFLLKQGDPYPQLFTDLLELLHLNDGYAAKYILFEVSFLKHIGFGLDLSKCAITGAKEKLSYVSPKTGRAACFFRCLHFS